MALLVLSSLDTIPRRNRQPGQSSLGKVAGRSLYLVRYPIPDLIHCVAGSRSIRRFCQGVLTHPSFDIVADIGRIARILRWNTAWRRAGSGRQIEEIILRRAFGAVRASWSAVGFGMQRHRAAQGRGVQGYSLLADQTEGIIPQPRRAWVDVVGRGGLRGRGHSTMRDKVVRFNGR